MWVQRSMHDQFACVRWLVLPKHLHPSLLHLSPALPAADQVQQALAAQHINLSVSRIGSSRSDFEQRGLTEVVRASVHYYNTEAELQRCIEAVQRLAASTP